MSQSQMMKILILSIFCLIGSALAGEETIKFEVCSFRPNTPRPTANPITVAPRPTYKPITLAPTTSSGPDVETTTTPAVTTTPRDDEIETGESSSPEVTTTPAVETTPTTTTTTTTTKAPVPPTTTEAGTGEDETGESSTTKTEPTKTPAPETPVPTTTEAGTGEDETGESSTTKTEPTKTPAPTTEGDEGSDETGETTATTAKPTTAKPTTEAPDPEGETEEETPAEGEGKGNNPRRGMDDEEEKLISHKRLLTVDYDEWPSEYSDINTTAEAAMKELLTNYTAKIGTVEFKSVSSVFVNYTDSDTTRVYYELTYTVNVDAQDATQKDEWDKLLNRIESNHETDFYNYFTNRTDAVGPYGVCTKPKHLKEVTPCSYGRLTYLYKTTQTENLDITPASKLDGYTINYTIRCTNEMNDDNKKYLEYTAENGDGIVKVKVDKATSYSLCSVTCTANDTEKYRNGYTSFTIKVSDNKPTYSKIGSSFPSSAISSRKFSVSVKLVYPSSEKPSASMKIHFDTNDNCSVPYNADKSPDSNGFIIFNDLLIHCVSNSGKLIQINYIITDNKNNILGLDNDGNNITSTIKVTPSLVVQEDFTYTNEDGSLASNDTTDEYNLTNAGELQYLCEGNKEADVNGLCCGRDDEDYKNGKSCTTSTVRIPFEGTNKMTDKEWEKFEKSYLDTLRRVVYNNTNFKFVDKTKFKGEDKNQEIEIENTFYEHKPWLYSGVDNVNISTLVRRSLDGENENENEMKGINWKALSSPYDYINTIISFVNPAAVPDTADEETGGGSDGGNAEEKKAAKILESLPPEMQEFLDNADNKELKEKLVKAVEEVPKAVAETTGSVVEEINEDRQPEERITVSVDSNKGLVTEEEIPENVTPAVSVLVKSTLKPTKEPYKTPKPGTGGEDLPSSKNKPWAEEYWWAILLICIGAVLIIGIVVAVLVISLSSSGSSKTNKKDIEKSEKIMETVIPIDKIKQENEISDDDIYKPFSYEVIMEGYLLKEGRDRVVGKWQRRYCVLYFEPSVLRIYDSMVPSYYGKVYIDEKQSIPLECYNGIEYKEGSNEFTLILKVRDSTIKAFEVGDKERKIQMKVEGENGVETAKRWVECFRDFKSQKPKSGDAWTRPLIIDQNNGKISTTTNKAVEKKNEEIVLKAQQRRQAAASTK